MIVKIPKFPYAWSPIMAYDLDLQVVVHFESREGRILRFNNYRSLRNQQRVWRRRFKSWQINPMTYHPDNAMDEGL